MTELNNIKVATLTERLPEGRGFIAEIENGERVFIIAQPIIESRLTVGHKVVVVIKPYRGREDIDWFADWAVPHGTVTIESVTKALDTMRDGYVWTAGEIGPNEGDLLYRAGITTKYIRMKYKNLIDSYEDISYTLYPERVSIDEFENEEAE